DRAAFGVAQELGLAPAPQREQRRVGERLARVEVRQGAALRVLVPRADELAVVAAVDAVADQRPQLDRDRLVALDRQVRDAAASIDAVRRDDGLRRAYVQAGAARAAVGVDRRGEGQRDVEV